MDVEIIVDSLLDILLYARGSKDYLLSKVQSKFPTAKFTDYEGKLNECDDAITLTADEFDADIYFLTDKKNNMFVTEIITWEIRGDD